MKQPGRSTRGRRNARAPLAAARAQPPKTGFAEVLDLATHEILIATYGFDPSAERTRGPFIIRFFGNRAGVGTKARPGDRFMQDERIDGVGPESGPISVTTRVRGINPGEWLVSARVITADGDQRLNRARPGGLPDADQPFFARWSWPRWSLQRVEPGPLRTKLAPLATPPAVIPGLYSVVAVVGMVVALVLQQSVLARVGVSGAQVLTISVIAILAGLVGSKARHLADHWPERRIEGWSIQGFLPATAIVGAIGLALAGIPIGAVLDASTPGTFAGIAIGRIGCFFAGCCAGRPTSSAWGLWSSDQRIGARRIPTQFLESGLNLLIAAITLALVLTVGAGSGAVLVAGIALYTLGRQGILRLRIERPRSLRGSAITAAVAAVVFVLSIVYAVRAG